MGRTILLSVVLLTLLAWIPSNKVDEIAIQLENHSELFPTEKVYLHFNKPYYSISDRIWFKSYITSTAVSRDKSSKVIKVELIDPNGSVLAHHQLKMKNGGAPGDFQLADTLKPGKYSVRAFTNWMQNFGDEFFFQRTFEVYGKVEDATQKTLSPKKIVSLSFFPEGGNLVNNQTSIVAFKATMDNGSGVDIEGVITDERGKKITAFFSEKLGMGKFLLTPEKDSKYHAVIGFNGEDFRFELPKSRESGFTLKVIHSYTNENVTIIANSEKESLGKSFIIAHSEGKVFAKVRNSGNDNFFVTKIPKEKFPQGICQLTLFDSLGRPRCERLLMVNMPKSDVKLNARFSKETYQQRDRVDVDFELTNVKNKFVSSGEMSVTIVPSELFTYPKNDHNIRNYLLLSSELKGYIEEPEFYLKKDDFSYKCLDNLLLTHGWRRFTWEEIFNKSYEPIYQVESGISISGKLFYNNSKDPVQGHFSAILQDRKGTGSDLDFGKTKEDGSFVIKDIDLEGPFDGVVQGYRSNKKGKTRRNVTVELEMPFANTTYENENATFATGITSPEDYFEKRKQLQSDISIVFDDDVQLLDEVRIETQREKYELDKAPYPFPTHRLEVTPAMGFDITHVLSRVPGLNIRYRSGLDFITSDDPGLLNISVRRFSGSSTIVKPPVLVYDGRIMDMDFLTMLSPEEIKFIDVLVGVSANIFYNTNLAIVVYPKKASDMPSPGVANFNYMGFYQAREFYSPDHNASNPVYEKPDLRSTFFWSPSVEIDSSGRASLNFYTSDQVGVFDMIVEGLLDDGTPIVLKEKLHIE